MHTTQYYSRNGRGDQHGQKNGSIHQAQIFATIERSPNRLLEPAIFAADLLPIDS